MSLPDGWYERRFDQFGIIYSGSTPSTSVASFWDGDIVWITPADLSRLTTRYLHDSEKRITEKGLKGCSTHLLPVGSVVMSSRAPIGYVALPTVPFCTNQGCKTIKLKNGFNSEFTYYNILFNIEKVKNLGEGTTFAEISKTALEKVALPFPTDSLEQAKIAEILSTVDQAIEQTEALIAKQERITTGLMQDLLTRGIDEHGNLRSESTHQFKDSPLGRIPVEWEPTNIDSLTKFVTSGSRGWAKYYAVEGDRFLRIGDLTRDHINLRSHDVAFVTPPASSEGKRTAVEAGDVLVSITADLGIIGVIPEDFSTAYVNQHIALARIERDAANPRYVGWYLSSRGGQRQFEALNESGAKAGLNLPTIRNLQVPIPSDPIRGREEQDRIAAILDKAAKGIEDAIRKKDKLVRLKTGVMQDLLTGKKRVTPLLEMVETQ